MAHKTDFASTVEDADKILGLMDDNADFNIKGATKAQIKAQRDALAAVRDEVKDLREQMSVLVDRSADLDKEVRGYASRGRSAARGYFGPDSVEYGRAGGKRASERKPRKSVKTTPSP